MRLACVRRACVGGGLMRVERSMWIGDKSKRVQRDTKYTRTRRMPAVVSGGRRKPLPHHQRQSKPNVLRRRSTQWHSVHLCVAGLRFAFMCVVCEQKAELLPSSKGRAKAPI